MKKLILLAFILVGCGPTSNSSPTVIVPAPTPDSTTVNPAVPGCMKKCRDSGYDIDFVLLKATDSDDQGSCNCKNVGATL